MERMLAAKAAILSKLHPIGRVFLFLECVVVALLALCARKRDLSTHAVRHLPCFVRPDTRRHTTRRHTRTLKSLPVTGGGIKMSTKKEHPGQVRLSIPKTF